MTDSRDVSTGGRLVLHDLTWFIRYLLLMRLAHWVWFYLAILTSVVALVALAIESPGRSAQHGGLWLTIALHVAAYAVAVGLLALNSHYGSICEFRFRANDPRPLRLLHPATAALCGCQACLFGWNAVNDSDVLVRILEGAAALLVAIAAIAVYREKRQSILGPDAGGVVAFVASLANERDCRKAPPPRNLRSGVVCGLSALICALCALFDLLVMLPVVWSEPQREGQILLLTGLVMLLSLYLTTRGRYYLQPQFDALIATDPRPPVLYLRSFRADERMRPWKLWSMGRQFSDGTVEQRLARHFSGRGPFIAIGSPQNPIVLGAVRIQLREDEWQDRVMEWIHSSSAIVLMAGTTQWIDWELTKIVNFGYLQKLILLFPRAERRARRKQQEEANVHFAALRASFEGTIWESSLAQIENPQNLRGMVFRPDGGLDVIVSRSRSILSFEWAAFLAHFWQNQNSPIPFVRERRDVRARSRKRRVAAFLDVVLVLSVWASLGLIVRHASPWILRFVLAGSAAIALPLYFTVCEGLLGATAGQAIAGIRLMTDNGKRPRIRTILVRVGLSFLPGIFRGIKAAVTSTEVVSYRFAKKIRVVAAMTWVFAMGVGLVSFVAWLDWAVPSEPSAPAGFREIPASALLQSTGTMRAGDVAFTQGRDGPARSPVYQAGDVVDLEFELIGFGRDSSGREDIRLRGSLLSANGATTGVASPSQLNGPKNSADPDVIWLEFPTDPCAPPGPYQIRVQAHDVVRNADLAFQADLQLTGGASCHAR